MLKSRGAIDDTLAAMFSNIDYRNDYLFYAHMIGQCSIKIRDDLQAPAGVAFMYDHYNLYINPHDIWEALSEFTGDITKLKPKDLSEDKDGNKIYRKSIGFDSFNLKERLAILKHEMLHILYGHIQRLEDRIFLPWNLATDCAHNQHINEQHLPDIAILPASLGEIIGIELPNNESAEFYYEKIKQSMKDSENLDGEDSGQSMDSHETWRESKGDKDFQADITKKMTEKAQTATIKSKGNVPSEFAKWLELHTRKAEVNWKKVLRGIVGNKRVGTRSTIMRNDRRLPNRADLRGKVKERVFNLLVVCDVSGSMSDEAILGTIGEVKHICNVTKTAVDLIQIDTQAYPPEKISKTTNIINRKATGGTYLSPALNMAKEHNLDYQAIVILTDGEIYNEEIEIFKNTAKKIIWLIEKNGSINNEMQEGRMKAFKLKV